MAIEISGEVTTVSVNGVIYGGGVGKTYVDNAIAAALLAYSGGKVRLIYDPLTEEKGIQTKIINKTGAASVKGCLVTASKSYDMAVELQTNEFDTIGIIAESGIEDGVEVWIWKNGSICQVLANDNDAATRGFLAIADATNGRATFIEVPNTNPVQAEHFKEIGHVLESKAGGVNVLVLCEIHFN